MVVKRITPGDLRLLGAWAAAYALLAFTVVTSPRAIGFDSHAYWLAWHRVHMYGQAPNTQDAYLYPPVFAQLLWPLAQLPWPVFLSLWTAAGFACYAWLLWPVRWRYRLPLLLICVPQAIVGNIWPAFAVVAVLGFRRPALWAVPLLTKVTAATGFVWFAARREWRCLATAAGTALVVAGASAAVSPGLWEEWARFVLVGGSGGGMPAGAPNIPLAVRLPLALALAAYAAGRGRRGLFVVTVGLASPVFALSPLLSNLAVLAALPRLGAAGDPA